MPALRRAALSPRVAIAALAVALLFGIIGICEVDGRSVAATRPILRAALPVLVLWVVAALAWRIGRRHVRLWRIATRGGHLIVAGDAGLAVQVAAAELARGGRVLLYDGDPRARWMSPLVDGGATSTGAPDRLAQGKARAVLLLGTDDAANAALARALVDAAQGTREVGDPLDVIVRVDDLDRRRVLERQFDGDRGDARVRFACLPDLAARELFVEAPLDRFHRDGQAARVVFLLGVTPAIERYVRRLLAGGHFRDGVRPRLVAVARDPAAAAAGFAARNPGADLPNPITWETGTIDPPSTVPALVADLAARHGAPVAIVIDGDDDERTVAAGSAIADDLAARDEVAPPIHLRLSGGHHAPADPGLRAFGTAKRFADPEQLLQEDHDALARSIHDFYLEGRFDDGEALGGRASLNEWEDLPESFRDDNRLVADCYALKLRDIGARVVTGTGVPMRIDADELEELSRAEHDRWMGSKLADGWTHGATRDDAARRHPDIVPYDALSERIKDLDREQVRAITRLLSHAGRRALRTLIVGVAAGVEARDADPLIAALAAHYPDRVPLFAGDPAGGAAGLLGSAQRAGAPVLLTLAGNAARLGADASLAALLRDADTIVATADPAGWIARHAALTVGGDIRLDARGGIVAAPWR